MKTRKNMKRIVALLSGLLLIFMTFRIFTVISYAYDDDDDDDRTHRQH